MFSVHVKPEEFKNGGLTRKTHQMFSIGATPEEFKNAKIPAILDSCLRKTRARISHDYCDAVVSEKLRFQNVLRAY